MEGNRKFGISKSTLAIAVLSVLLVIALGYIGITQYQTTQQQRDLGIFQQGQQSGAQQTTLYLFQQGASCQPIPITANNQTMNMLPVECVSQSLFLQGSNCQPMPITVGNQTLNLLPMECIYQRASQCQAFTMSFGNQSLNLVALECFQNSTQQAG